MWPTCIFCSYPHLTFMSHRQNIWIMVKAQTLWWGFVFVLFFFWGGEELQPLVINCFSWLAWYILKECVQKSFLFFLPLMEYCPSGLSSASASSASKNNCSVFVWCVRGPNQTDQCKSEWTVLNHLYTQLHNKLLKCTFMFDFCLFVCFYLKHTVKNI